MRKKTQLVIGGLILLYGLLLLIGEIFHIRFGKLCWPVVLILVGLFLIFLPRLYASRPGFQLNIFPDIHRRGAWKLQPEELLVFVGDVDLDLTQAEIPPGETAIRVYGFVGDIDLIVPPEVGVQVASTAFVSDARLWQQKQSRFISTLEQSSPNYTQAERKVRLETYLFVSDLKVDQA
jgi:predicted membrane protein